MRYPVQAARLEALTWCRQGCRSMVVYSGAQREPRIRTRPCTQRSRARAPRADDLGVIAGAAACPILQPPRAPGCAVGALASALNTAEETRALTASTTTPTTGRHDARRLRRSPRIASARRSAIAGVARACRTRLQSLGLACAHLAHTIARLLPARWRCRRFLARGAGAVSRCIPRSRAAQTTATGEARLLQGGAEDRAHARDLHRPGRLARPHRRTRRPPDPPPATASTRSAAAGLPFASMAHRIGAQLAAPGWAVRRQGPAAPEATSDAPSARRGREPTR